MTTATQPLPQDGFTETYQDLSHFVDGVVRKFVACYGGDFRELRQDADFLFMRAWVDHDKQKNQSQAFEPFLRNWVWYGLLDQHRTWLRRRHTLRYTNALPDMPEAPGLTNDFLDGISQDAALVIQLCLETPAELEAAVAARGGHPRNLRSCVREYLAKLGWAADRIRESFDEIRSVL